MDDEGRITNAEYIRELWPMRHNAFTRVHVWNAIGRERRHRAHQAFRYPYPRRFTVPSQAATRIAQARADGRAM